MNVTEKKEGYGFLIDWIIRFGDLLLLNLFFFLIFYIFKNNELILENFHYKEKITTFLLINLCYIITSYFIKYNISPNITYLDKIVQRSSAFICVYMLLVTAGFAILGIIRLPILTWLAAFFILGTLYITWHILFRLFLKTYRRSGHNYKEVVIIGGGEGGQLLYDSIIDGDFGYKVLGYFDDKKYKNNPIAHYLGGTSDIWDYIENNHIDEIFYTLSGNQDNLINKLVKFCEKHMIRFHMVPEFHNYIKRRLSLHFIESTPVLSLRYEPLESLSNRILKRGFDVVFSGLFLITVFPFVYLIFGAIIKITSPGPIFFKQKRTGIQGQEFYCYKFRSMQVNKEANSKQATANDPRVTKIGAFMRKTSVDELPQFINVFRNEMSVVGPRPHMLKHTNIYSELISKFMVRHLVKPGITGWAQVTGYRGETKTIKEMKGRVKKDVWYLENWTFFLDLKIIFLTVYNVFRGEEKAY